MKRLGMPPDSFASLDELLMLQDAEERNTTDIPLREHLELAVSELEAQAIWQPFLEPTSENGLGDGKVHILNTLNGHPIRVGFADGEGNEVKHILIVGASGLGKSCLMALLAVSAARSCHTVIIDSVKFYRRIPAIRATHRFVRQYELRWNLFQYPKNLPPKMGDQVVVGEICGSYSLIFGAYVLAEVIQEIRELGMLPNLPGVVERLKKKRYQGFSKRSQYRDSAVLVLENLLNGTGDLFKCAHGMDLSQMLQDNVVIELDGLPEHQAFLTRYLFEYVRLMKIEERGGE